MQQHVTIGPIREDGRITGVMVAIEDVTARVEREQALSKASPEMLTSLTRDLGADEWRVRQGAVQGLACQGPAIVDTLVRTLREQHRNFSVLSSMLDLLAMADIDVIDSLIGCLTSADVDLRIQAALILGERRDRRAVPARPAAPTIRRQRAVSRHRSARVARCRRRGGAVDADRRAP
jgi:HEAT repeat protein